MCSAHNVPKVGKAEKQAVGRGGWGGVGRGGAWRVKGKPKEKQKGNSAGVGGFS